MKTFRITAVILALAVVACAQSAPAFVAPTVGNGGPIATDVKQCPISQPHTWLMCPVETGPGAGVVYISVNGSTPILLAGGGSLSGVVLSFNGHKPDASGNVAPASGDYSYPQIANTPPTVTFNGRPPDSTFNFVPTSGDYNYLQIAGAPANPVLDVNGQAGPHVKLTATTTVTLPPVTPVATTTIP